jgi:hypothetical protein
MKKFAVLWSLCAGAMDALTGLLLILCPSLVLRLLGIPPLTPETTTFLAWVGVFVASVGLSYGWSLRGGTAAETVWGFTAMIRLAVAAFLSWQILSRNLPPAWATVAISDALVATIQIVGLRAGWWKDRST